MRFFQTCLTILILTLSFSTNYGQSGLRKANKQYELGAYNVAIKSYLKVLDRQPRNVQALGRLADCYRHLNNMNEAEKHFSRLTEMRNVEPEHYLNYGHVLKAQGKYDAAKRYYYKYAEKYPVAGNQYAESCNFAVSKVALPPSTKITNEFLNTGSADFSPAIYQDGKVVYASSRRDIRSNDRNAPKSNTLGGNQLFITMRDANGFLKKPDLMRKNFGGTQNEGPIAYSPDGKLVAVTRNNYVNGTRQIPTAGFELSLHIAEVTSNGDFTNIVPFPYNGSGYSTGFASFSPDGKELYFASDRPDGFGGFDIYVSQRIGNSWSAPENLGAVVNSQGNEITPFFNGTDLFFASDWHFGFGGLDIFRSQKMTTGGWNQVQHLGTGFNSSRDDFGYVYDRTFGVGYFVSNRLGGKGNEDIYQFTGSVGSGGSGGTISGGGSGGNVILNIFNGTTREPLSGVTIDLSECGGPSRATTNADGVYSFSLQEGSICNPFLRKNGFVSKRIILNTSLENNLNLEVLMTEEGDFYSGQVIHGGTRTTLDAVIVRATNTATNQRLETSTDRSGKYSLALQGNSNYIVRYSKIGFKDVNRTIRTGGPNNSKIIETIYLPPSGTNIDEPIYSGNSGNDRNPTMVDPINDATDSAGSQPRFRNGFAVQIASLSGEGFIPLSDFENKVGSVGNVFVHSEGGRAKVRVGIYETREEAKEVQAKLRSRNFQGAFTVAQTTLGHEADIWGEALSNPEPEPEIIEEPPTSGNSGYKPPSSSGGTVSGNSSRYMIRLGAFRNPDSFNRNERDKYVSIGILDSYKKGAFTIIILTGYDTMDSANRALRKVKAKGNRDAYVIEEIGGEYVRAR